MPLSRLIYYAKVVKPSTAETDLLAIRNASLVNYTRLAITGALIAYNGYFVQLLEGRRPFVSNALVQIIQDPWSSELALVDFRAITERRFADWAMFAEQDAGVGEMITRFMPGHEFTPSDMMADAFDGIFSAIAERARMGQAGRLTLDWSTDDD